MLTSFAFSYELNRCRSAFLNPPLLNREVIVTVKLNVTC